jgi:hypothetical protein
MSIIIVAFVNQSNQPVTLTLSPAVETLTLHKQTVNSFSPTVAAGDLSIFGLDTGSKTTTSLNVQVGTRADAKMTLANINQPIPAGSAPSTLDGGSFNYVLNGETKDSVTTVTLQVVPKILQASGGCPTCPTADCKQCQPSLYPAGMYVLVIGLSIVVLGTGIVAIIRNTRGK